MIYALAYQSGSRLVPVGNFNSIEEAMGAASVVNIERKGRGLAPVVAVVDRATLTVQKWL